MRRACSPCGTVVPNATFGTVLSASAHADSWLANEQPQEERPADERGDDADRQLQRREHRARDQVARDEKRRAETERRGHHDRWSGPTSSRTRCGTMMPTKPIGPPIETAAPVASDALRNAMRCMRTTSTPRAAA